jgi:hypothetical protein
MPCGYFAVLADNLIAATPAGRRCNATLSKFANTLAGSVALPPAVTSNPRGGHE